MAQPLASIETVQARAEVRIGSQNVSQQEGADGRVTVVHVRGEGPMTSNDPRLEGIFKADAVIMVDERGAGASRDDWEIVDAGTRQLKAKGTSHGIHSDPEPIRASVLGRLEDGSRLFADARVTLPPPGTEEPIVIEYGGPGLSDPANRAVILRGTCPPLVDAE